MALKTYTLHGLFESYNIEPNYIIAKDENKCIRDNYHIPIIMVVVQMFDFLYLLYVYLIITVYYTLYINIVRL